MKPHYKRVLVKISGEQLAGAAGNGIDQKTVEWIATEIKEATAVGAEIVIMIGGGNIVRGARIAGNKLSRVTADYMGMLSTMINALALGDIFNADGLPTRVLTAIKADQVADFYTQRRAISHLQKGRVVVLAGGTARPYLTTDTAAVNLALELDCDAVCKVTKVDGVYDKDPEKHDDAERFTHISFQKALEDPAIRVMDKAALGLAMECNKAVVVCDLETPGNIKRLVLGEKVGTLMN
jgi:uridylate kinase